MRATLCCACAVWASLAGGPAAQAGPSEPAQPAFRSGTDVVVLDAVVRDRRGRIVRDLTPAQFEVYEDGERQPISSFRFFERGAALDPGGPPPDRAPGGAARPAAGAAPEETGAAAAGSRVQTLRHPNLVTLVFDQLGPQARGLARQAALEFIQLQDRPDVFVSVFQIGHTLQLTQQFTTDRKRLHAAITQATGEVDTRYVAGTDDLASAVRAAEEARGRMEAAAVGGAEGAAAVAGLAQQAAMADFVVNALRMTQTLQREQQGTASLYALLALAKKQRALSGRKTMLFFSEGLQAPPSLEHVLKSTISEANRANVSIYAVDARGLLTGSDMHEARDVLQDAVDTSRAQNMSRGGRPVTREEVMIGDTAESAIRMNPQATLGELAGSTGGALIGNSNDLRRGISRAVGDLSGYYEVAYTPTNRAFDGRFRRIAIKIARPGLIVQARSGYFALPPGEAAIDFPFELDLLMSLRGATGPGDLPLRVRTFSFGYEGERRRVTMVAELPLDAIRLVPASGGRHAAHFSFLALVRGDTGTVAEKFSEDTPVLVPKERTDGLRQGSAIFIRSFALAPGRYELQAAARDQHSERRGLERVPIAVAPPRGGLAMSTPAFIKRTEPITPGALPSPDPFRVTGARIVPFVAVPEVASGDLPLFLMVYPGTTEPAPDKVLLEFSRDGKVTGRSNPALPPPDARGHISFIAPIPVARFPPGAYDLRVVVQQGLQTVEERLTFMVIAPAGGPPR